MVIEFISEAEHLHTLMRPVAMLVELVVVVRRVGLYRAIPPAYRRLGRRCGLCVEIRGCRITALDDTESANDIAFPTAATDLGQGIF